MTEAETPRTTIRFGRRSSRGFLLGFSGARVACIFTAAVTMIGGLFLGGATGLAATGTGWVPLLAGAFVRVNGSWLVDVFPTGGHYALRTATGQTRYLARPDKPRPAGTLALPGDAAALRFHLDTASGAVMVHDPHHHTLTAIARVTHPAYVLLGADEQQRRVNAWGRTLAGLAATGTCARLQVLETTQPDSGQGITGWWDAHGSREATQWAVGQYQQLMDTCAPAAATHRTLVALSLDMHAASRAIRHAGSGLVGAAAVLAQDMAGFESGLRSAELDLQAWLSPTELAGVLRLAYDPAAAATLDADTVGHDLATAGPVAVEEHWDHLRHDTGHSAVLWVSEWPRIEVPAHFLHGLVFAPGVRKTISITATPSSTATALRDIRKAKVSYLTDAAQKAKIGSVADAADSQELTDVLDREQALIAGHADYRFTGLIAITATSKDDLDAAVAQVGRAAVGCGCETRLLAGQQARAFTTAALPLARRIH